MRKIVLIGSGGHANSVISSINKYSKLKYKFIGCIDKYKEISSISKIIANDISDKNVNILKKYYFIVAVGNNEIRKEWFQKIQKYNLKTVNIIDKTAIIAKDVKLGSGNFIGSNVTITSNITIGDNNIINTGSIIDHGSHIANHCNISPGAIINGDVNIEDNVWVGSGSIVFGQLNIGKNSITGAGSVVRKNVKDNDVVVGNPAKFLKKNK